MKLLVSISLSMLLLIAFGCKSKKTSIEVAHAEPVAEIYTCPMHPQVQLDKPGNCPICGMQLVRKVKDGKKSDAVDLEASLKPTNEFVISSIPVTTIQQKTEDVEIEALGNIAYDTRLVGSISSRVSGRIEKLYVHYRYQKIIKGQRILDIYSPELMTAQQNLVFLLKNDPGNASFIQAAKQKLLLLGMSSQQLKQVMQSGKPALTIAVFSNYSGHIHESAGANMNPVPGKMADISIITEELSLKEGMYVQKGQSIFTIYNPDRAWAVLNIYPENQQMVKRGSIARVIPETAPDKAFSASINFIEPFYQEATKTLTARVYFDNSILKIPIGSQVNATIFGSTKYAKWLPKEAVVSLGLDKVVFIKTAGGFKPKKIKTGTIHNNIIQVVDGIDAHDSVAVNAQYLMDSESFIKLKN